MDCYDTALKYSKERSQFGKPIGGFQLQQKTIRDDNGNHKAQLLAWRLGPLKYPWQKETMLKWQSKLREKPDKF